jgi:hypothetical protein
MAWNFSPLALKPNGQNSRIILLTFGAVRSLERRWEDAQIEMRMVPQHEAN